MSRGTRFPRAPLKRADAPTRFKYYFRHECVVCPTNPLRRGQAPSNDFLSVRGRTRAICIPAVRDSSNRRRVGFSAELTAMNDTIEQRLHALNIETEKKITDNDLTATRTRTDNCPLFVRSMHFLRLKIRIFSGMIFSRRSISHGYGVFWR